MSLVFLDTFRAFIILVLLVVDARKIIAPDRVAILLQVTSSILVLYLGIGLSGLNDDSASALRHVYLALFRAFCSLCKSITFLMIHI